MVQLVPSAAMDDYKTTLNDFGQPNSEEVLLQALASMASPTTIHSSVQADPGLVKITITMEKQSDEERESRVLP